MYWLCIVFIFARMWSRCDENADGTIDFQEFLSKLVRGTSCNLQCSNPQGRFTWHNFVACDDLIISLRHLVRKIPKCLEFNRILWRYATHFDSEVLVFLVAVPSKTTLLHNFHTRYSYDLAHRFKPFTNFNISYLQGVDIIGGDINGLSTRIHDENEAKVQFMKQDQSTRYESYWIMRQSNFAKSF